MKTIRNIIPVLVIYLVLSGCGGSDIVGPDELAVSNISTISYLDSVTISWTTNLASKGTIYYGLDSTALDSSVQDTTEFITDHVLTIYNLQQDTTYYFYIEANSSDLQTAQSSIDSFFTGIVVILEFEGVTSTIETNEARIAWSTNIPSKGVINYGTVMNNLDNISPDTLAFETDHTDTLHYLASGTTYYYSISIWSADLQTLTTDTFYFNVPNDSILNIYDFSLSFLSNTSTSIRFYTNKHAETIVYYGLAGEAYSDTIVDNVARLEHQFSIDTLAEESDYILRVVALENTLMLSDTLDTTFSTPALLSVTIPEDTVTVGNVFLYPVTINNALDLNGMQYHLLFDPDHLRAQRVIEGPFSSNAGSMFFQTDTNNIEGFIKNEITWNPIFNGDIIVGTDADGDGIVAYVEFQAISTGMSEIIIPADSLLILDINIIPFDVAVDSGSVTIQSP